MRKTRPCFRYLFIGRLFSLVGEHAAAVDTMHAGANQVTDFACRVGATVRQQRTATTHNVLLNNILLPFAPLSLAVQ